MPFGSGLGGFVGVAPESVYGTYVAASKFPEVHSAKIVRRPHYVQGTGLAAGRLVDPVVRHANTWYDGSGPVVMEFLSSQMGQMLNNIMGSTGIPIVIASTAAYTLTCPLGSTDGTSMSIQAGIPDTTGTLHPYTALGCKVTDAEFSCDRGSLLLMTMTVDAQDVSEVPTIQSPSFVPGASPFHGDQIQIKMGPLGSEVAIDGIKKWSMKITRAMDTSRIYLGNNLKEAPVTNGMVKITGSLDVDLVNATTKAALQDMFSSQTFFSMIADFTGPQIGSSGHNNELKLSSPSVLLTGATPDLSGPQVVSTTIPFEILLDVAGDNPLTATWISGDTAL